MRIDEKVPRAFKLRLIPMLPTLERCFSPTKARQELRRRFPSGRLVGIHFSPNSTLSVSKARTGRPLATVIWIDGACIAKAEQIVADHQSGKITAGDAEKKLYSLEYGNHEMPPPSHPSR